MKKNIQQPVYPIYKKNDNIYMVVNGKPNSKQSQITGIQEDCIDISISAPAKANTELIKFLSDILQIKRSQIILEKGGKSRNKLVCVQNSELSVQDILNLIQ